MNEPVIDATTLSVPLDTPLNGPPVVPTPWLRWAGHGGYVAERIVYVLIGAFGLVAALEPIVGFLARGVLFGLIGALLIDAARRYDTADATGITGALAALRRQEYGRWQLGLVAVGLISYGVFQIIKEPYRNIRAR